MTEWKRKENRYHMISHEGKDGLTYLTFPVLDGAENVRHLFSTRKGGVSRGIYESMNLSFHRGDDAENVLENFRRIAALFDSTPDKIVCAKQTHTTNIRRVTKVDAGKGVTKEPDYEEIDGLITNEPGLILCTSFADCVPLYFVDPKKQAIGLAHSGWRGTVNRMGARMEVIPEICLWRLVHRSVQTAMKWERMLPGSFKRLFRIRWYYRRESRRASTSLIYGRPMSSSYWMPESGKSILKLQIFVPAATRSFCFRTGQAMDRGEICVHFWN